MHISPGSIARNCTTTTKRLGLPNRLQVAPPSMRSSIPLPPVSIGSLGRISGSSSVQCSNLPPAPTDQVVSSILPVHAGGLPETAISGTVTSLGGLKDSVGRRRDVTFPLGFHGSPCHESLPGQAPIVYSLARLSPGGRDVPAAFEK
jgi:hypothetical protein